MGSVETVETFWQLRLSTWPLCGLSGRLQVMLIHTLFSKAYRILHACPKFKLGAVHVNTIAIGDNMQRHYEGICLSVKDMQ